MALRTDLPKIPVTDEPTIWNNSMGKWAFIGSFAGLLGPVAGLAGTVIGGLWGGYSRKSEMERELKEGKTVSDPTFWNAKILSNYMMVSVGTTLALVAAVATGMVNFDTLGSALTAAEKSGGGIADVMKTHAASVIALFGVMAAAVGAFVYGIAGGFGGKAEMQKDLDKAMEIKKGFDVEQAVARVQMRGQGMGRGMGQTVEASQPSYKNSVTADEMALLNARLSQGAGGGRSFAQGIEQAREAAAQQQPAMTQA